MNGGRIFIEKSLENCTISFGNSGQVICIEFKELSHNNSDEAHHDVTKCLMASDAKRQICQKHKKNARIDCSMSPARSSVLSVTSGPRGAVPVWSLIFGVLALLLLNCLPIGFILRFLCVGIAKLASLGSVAAMGAFSRLAFKRWKSYQGASLFRQPVSSERNEGSAPPRRNLRESQPPVIFVHSNLTGKSTGEILDIVAQCEASLPETSNRENTCQFAWRIFRLQRKQRLRPRYCHMSCAFLVPIGIMEQDALNDG